MAGKSRRKDHRGFYWTVLFLGLAWAAFCHVAPILPNGRLISFVAGMAPPLLLIAPSLLAVVILSFRAFRRPAWGALQAGFALLIITIIALLGIVVSLPGDASRTSVRAMTLNVHFSSRRLPKALAYIRKEKIDLVLLQENRGGESSPARCLARELGWHLEEADEVAILSRWPLKDSRAIGSKALRFRSLLSVQVQAPKPFRAVTVHWSSPQYLKGIEEMHLGAHRQSMDYRQTVELIASTEGPLILGGDFNNPPHHKHTRALSQKLESCFGSRGFGLGWTYPKRFPLVRIDHLYVGGGLKTESCLVGPDLGSDHLPLVAGLSYGP